MATVISPYSEGFVSGPRAAASGLYHDPVVLTKDAPMEEALTSVLKEAVRERARMTVLTGAGISAESGIPTFRGPEGYWTVGSREYHPQEMATFAMFSRHPRQVWKWYLYRMDTCRRAKPNAGHFALVEMEDLFPGRFTLITQNVDGLHLRAGSDPETTFAIHGDVFFMRCAAECSRSIYPMPADLPGKGPEDVMTEGEMQRLRCPSCGGIARPHVLWFDETYNEHHFRLESALRAAGRTDLLLVAGTSGATNLPNQVARLVHRKGGIIVDVNIEDNVFSRLAVSSGRGLSVRRPCAGALPEMLAAMKAVGA
jgi:NAD-dependent deacetylase